MRLEQTTAQRRNGASVASTWQDHGEKAILAQTGMPLVTRLQRRRGLDFFTRDQFQTIDFPSLPLSPVLGSAIQPTRPRQRLSRPIASADSARSALRLWQRTQRKQLAGL